MKIWDRQKNESYIDFEYFSHYRDSGKERCIKSTAVDFKKAENQLLTTS